VATVDETLAGFARDMETTEIAMRENVDAMRHYLEGMDHDPEVLRSKQERLDVLIALERRYGKDADALAGDLETWRAELEGLAFEDDRREALQSSRARAASALARAASVLGDKRRAAAPRLDAAVTAELDALMMKGATFRTEVGLAHDANGEVEVGGTPVALAEHGTDSVRLHVRPNPGEAEGPVDRIASTGETSRIALALKALTNAGAPGSVLIFDEIDAGVGGDLGDVIAAKLAALAHSYQIICITHMPQIAARAPRHLVVSKDTGSGRTRVRVRPVDADERRLEIARMLGGSEGSKRRLALAGELLERARS
jgi:DNA repair protein RecN (Recombination protein N)